MKNEKIDKALVAWIQSSTDLIGLMSSETRDDGDNAPGMIMAVCRGMIEFIVRDDMETKGKPSSGQVEWISEFALGLMEKVDPRIKSLVLTVIRVPEGQSVSEALKDFARTADGLAKEPN